MSKNTAIQVKDVSKDFVLPHNKRDTLKDIIIHPFERTTKEIQHALESISFEVKEGEFYGIVGRNGSGKSTLLKILAGVYYPTSGEVGINGSLVPFIELGVGFNPELSARDNVFLNASLLGFSREETRSFYDDIVRFAELENHMDQKLKNFSSGMQVRLAFSIAIRADSDILLIDEVLAVGDENFQKKCFSHFDKLKEQNKTVVFVSHDMGAVQRYCDRVLVLNNGEIVGEEEPYDANILYKRLNEQTQPDADPQEEEEEITKTSRWGSGEVTVSSIRLLNSSGKEETVFATGDDITIEAELDNPNKQRCLVGFGVNDENDNHLYGPNTYKKDLSNKQKVTHTFKNPFNRGEYTLTAAVFDENQRDTYDYLDKHLSFTVVNKNNNDNLGKVVIDGTWSAK